MIGYFGVEKSLWIDSCSIQVPQIDLKGYTDGAVSGFNQIR